MATNSQHAKSDMENQNLSNEEFRTLLKSNMKFKARSQDTHEATHVPELTTQLATRSIITLLLGDSMFERLKTTGIETSTNKAIMHPDSRNFNAGVGGDKIENVLYRLDLGLMDILAKQKDELDVCLVMVGTNNLTRKGPLKDVEVEQYRLLLQALLRVSHAKSDIWCCEIFKRSDIKDELVEESNAKLKKLIAEMNGNLGTERIKWLEAPEAIVEERLDDHVHLDEEGYKIWDAVLCKHVEQY